MEDMDHTVLVVMEDTAEGSLEEDMEVTVAGDMILIVEEALEDLEVDMEVIVVEVMEFTVVGA